MLVRGCLLPLFRQRSLLLLLPLCLVMAAVSPSKTPAKLPGISLAVTVSGKQKSRDSDTYFGFTPFPYDATLEAVTKTRATISANSTLWALHFDNGIPWKEALADSPFPARF